MNMVCLPSTFGLGFKCFAPYGIKLKPPLAARPNPFWDVILQDTERACACDSWLITRLFYDSNVC